MTNGINGMSFGEMLRDLEAVRREVDRAFEEANRTGWLRPFSRSSFLPGWRARSYPLFNVSEDTDAVYVEALAPGLDPETLNLSVHQDKLSISGEKLGLPDNIKSECFHRSERAVGKFARTIELPVGIDPEKVNAEYKNGMLLVTLPKGPESKPKRITVNTN